MATRLTQPYRAGARPASPALQAMLRGKTFSGDNPMDAQRRVALLTNAGKRARPKRAVRPARPQRPAR